MSTVVGLIFLMSLNEAKVKGEPETDGAGAGSGASSGGA
jgi:hypothetical protein